MNDIAFAVVFVGIDNPAPTISGNCAGVVPRLTGNRELVSDGLPVFHRWHDVRVS
jgi:hypothetical protein